MIKATQEALRTVAQRCCVRHQGGRHLSCETGHALESALAEAIRLSGLHCAQQRRQQLRPVVCACDAGSLA